MKCYQCKHEWTTKLKEGLPKACPSCGRVWRSPTLTARLRGAWDGFLQKPKPIKHKDQTIRDIYFEQNKAVDSVATDTLNTSGVV